MLHFQLTFEKRVTRILRYQLRASIEYRLCDHCGFLWLTAKYVRQQNLYPSKMKEKDRDVKQHACKNCARYTAEVSIVPACMYQPTIPAQYVAATGTISSTLLHWSVTSVPRDLAGTYR